MSACLDKKCFQSALILALCAIDQLAWLSLSEEREVTSQDFISWTNRYVVSESSLDCTSEDLYGARCGLVHSLTAESRLAKQGKATPIAYSWGNQPPYPRADLKKYGMNWIMLHIETLCKTVEEGAFRFWRDVESDPIKLALVNRKVVKLFQPDTTLPQALL